MRNTEGGDTGHKKQADDQDESTVGCLEYIPKGKIVLHITRDALNAAKWTTLPLFVGQENAEFSSLINFVDLKRAVGHVRVKTAKVVPEENRNNGTCQSRNSHRSAGRKQKSGTFDSKNSQSSARS